MSYKRKGIKIFKLWLFCFQRFGCGLTDVGQINLKKKKYERDYRPIQEDCDCSTCKNYTRAYLHSVVTLDTVACHLLSVHNVAYQVNIIATYCFFTFLAITVFLLLQ